MTNNSKPKKINYFLFHCCVRVCVLAVQSIILEIFPCMPIKCGVVRFRLSAIIIVVVIPAFFLLSRTLAFLIECPCCFFSFFLYSQCVRVNKCIESNVLTDLHRHFFPILFFSFFSPSLPFPFVVSCFFLFLWFQFGFVSFRLDSVESRSHS